MLGAPVTGRDGTGNAGTWPADKGFLRGGQGCSGQLCWRAVLGLPRAAWLLIQSLPSRGFHHNLSWDARGLGFAAGVLPAPPPLPGCLQPVPRAAASVPDGQPSLLPPVLEAVCNDSVPGLPGVSNFTVYLYCNLFNSSRASGQRLGNLGAACSNAAWYLSAGEGGSAWAQACRERYPAQFNSTVCSNTSLRETPGPQQVLLEQLCADLARGLAGARPPSRTACPLGARWEDAWNCFLGSRVLWGARLCGSGSRELLPTDLRAWLSQLCGGPQPQAQMPSASEPGGTDPCSRAQSLWAGGNTGLLELCRTVPPSCFQELVCTNASLLQLLGHPQPVVGVHCQDALPGGHCLLKQLLALLPLHPKLDAADLCPDPAAYLLGLASQLPQCQEEAPGWAPHVNYLLRLLDRSLALSRREEAGQAAGEQLSNAILLSSLLDNTSFWGLLRANASRGILRAVGWYLGWEHRASAKRELLSCFSVSCAGLRGEGGPPCVRDAGSGCQTWQPLPPTAGSGQGAGPSPGVPVQCQPWWEQDRRMRSAQPPVAGNGQSWIGVSGLWLGVKLQQGCPGPTVGYWARSSGGRSGPGHRECSPALSCRLCSGTCSRTARVLLPWTSWHRYCPTQPGWFLAHPRSCGVEGLPAPCTPMAWVPAAGCAELWPPRRSICRCQRRASRDCCSRRGPRLCSASWPCCTAPGTSCAGRWLEGRVCRDHVPWFQSLCDGRGRAHVWGAHTMWGYSHIQGCRPCTGQVERPCLLESRAPMCEGFQSPCPGCVCAEPRRAEPVHGGALLGHGWVALGLRWFLGAVSCQSWGSRSFAGAVTHVRGGGAAVAGRAAAPWIAPSHPPAVCQPVAVHPLPGCV